MMEDFHVIVLKSGSYKKLKDIKDETVYTDNQTEAYKKAKDKLTHSGIYGIQETTATIEDWLDI